MKSQIKTIEVEVAVANFFDVRKYIIVPNVSYGLSGMHEVDLFVVTKAGYVKEIEIKVSKSDFLADKKKKHNHIDKENRINEFYYALPLELYEQVKDLIPETSGVITCSQYKNKRKETITTAKLVRKASKVKGSRKLATEELFKVTKLGCMRIFGLKDKINKLNNKLNNLIIK